MYRYLAVGATTKGSKVIGAGRLEATNAREWKLEALADLCEDHTFDHAVCSSSLPHLRNYKLMSSCPSNIGHFRFFPRERRSYPIQARKSSH